MTLPPTGQSALSRSDRAVAGGAVALTAAAAATRFASGVPHLIAFILAALALAAQAWVVSNATERVGERLGPAVTGTLQATVGNLPEFFVVLFALLAHQRTVAQTAILGSILSNALLVLGLVILAGSFAAKDQVMRFSPRLPQDATTLLLVASLLIVLLALVDSSHNIASHHVRAISVVGAVALLVAYARWMRQYLRPDPAAAPAGSPTQTPDRSVGPARAARSSAGLGRDIGLLVLAGAGSAFTSDWFIHALTPTIHQFHISPAFAGLVIVAIAGNAVEHAVGIVLAYRGKSDLAISVVKTSVAQIAAFLYPLLVLVSLLTATHLTFELAPVYAGALIGSAIIVWQITGDGEATPFEGVALIAVFVVIATVAGFGG